MKGIIKKYWLIALFGMIFGTMLYSFMMSQQLTNTFDGLWHQNYHHAGIPELTSGRWMLYFIDKLTMGLHSEPLTSLIALGLFTLGFLLVLELIGIEKKRVAFLGVALWLSSTVISNTLSYRMTSIGYGFAYLFSVLGIYLSVKIEGKLAAAMLSGIFLGLSMACYQAYLSVFCIVAVFYLMIQCSERGACEEKIIFSIILRMIGTVVIGAVTYIVSLSFFLKINGVSLSNYNGVGDITLLGLITDLPQNICKTYRYFGIYFLTDMFKLNRLQYWGGLYMLLILLAAIIVLIGVQAWKRNKICFLILVSAAMLIPIACNAYMLLAGDKLELQMTAGLAMLVPLTIITACSYILERYWYYFACTIFCLLLTYGNSMQVWFDQEAMYEGRNSCETIITQVIADLKDSNLLSKDYEYFFVGVPAKNKYFSVSEIYACANGYAQIGNFWVSGSCCQMSYHGLICKKMGFRLPMSDLYYEHLPENYAMRRAPTFPDDGYITVFGDRLVVIKISEHKKYSEYLPYEN